MTSYVVEFLQFYTKLYELLTFFLQVITPNMVFYSLATFKAVVGTLASEQLLHKLCSLRDG